MNAIKHNSYSDYEYRDPYRPLQRGKGGLGYREYNDYDSYLQTTPTYEYGRGRYRGSHPPHSRSERVKEGNQLNENKIIDNSNNADIRAMRETQKHKGGGTMRSINTDHKRSLENVHTNRKRKRRHVGPHDEKGLQRLLSTGSLAPTLLKEDHQHYNHSIDVVFATYWFFPAKTQAILPQDQHCIEKKMSEETIRFDPHSKIIYIS